MVKQYKDLAILLLLADKSMASLEQKFINACEQRCSSISPRLEDAIIGGILMLVFFVLFYIITKK